MLYADVDRLFISPNADSALLPTHSKAIEFMRDTTDIVCIKDDSSISKKCAYEYYRTKYRIDKFQHDNGLPNILDSKYKIR